MDSSSSGKTIPFQVEEIRPEEAVSRLQLGLHQEMPEAADRQRVTIEALSRKPCFRLRYGGDPHTIADALRQWFVVRDSVRPTAPLAPRQPVFRAPDISSDPLRRFRATCLRSDQLGRHLRRQTAPLY
jgi:hypothetical protein